MRMKTFLLTLVLALAMAGGEVAHASELSRHDESAVQLVMPGDVAPAVALDATPYRSVAPVLEHAPAIVSDLGASSDAAEGTVIVGMAQVPEPNTLRRSERDHLHQRILRATRGLRARHYRYATRYPSAFTASTSLPKPGLT
jgi:hypothetical protein